MNKKIKSGKSTSVFQSNSRLFLLLILILGFVLRIRFIDLCDVDDRGQTVFGMTNNLPPLYHYVSLPFLEMTNQLWYAPAFANMLFSLLSILLVYHIGKTIKNKTIGLLFSFLLSILPISILYTKFISPESLELFFFLAIITGYIHIEIKEDKGKLWLILYFLSIMIGAFAKQQTLSILAPIFLFGLYKHKMKIFYKEIYYISIIAAIPYFVFLFSHPELLAAIKIYYSQPTGLLTTAGKFEMLARGYVLYFLLYLPLVIYSFFRLKELSKQANKDFVVLIAILFVFYNIFIYKTHVYYYYLAFPIIALVGLTIYSMQSKIAKKIWLVLLFLYCILGFYLLLPHISMVTMKRCEAAFFNMPSTYTEDLFNIKPTTNRLFNIDNRFDLLENEKYILLGGSMGQDLKYNIHTRMYYAGVMNSPRFNEINYAIIAFPINQTYTGAPAWDYPYLEELLKNSELVETIKFAKNKDINIYKILNHDINISSIPDFKTRSRLGLKW